MGDTLCLLRAQVGTGRGGNIVAEVLKTDFSKVFFVMKEG